LAVGGFEDHLEFALTVEGRLRHVHHAPGATPADAAYFAVLLLQEQGLTPVDVAQIYLYGPGLSPAAFGSLETVFRLQPELLNPLSVVDLNPGSLTSGFDRTAYVGCIGAAM